MRLGQAGDIGVDGVQIDYHRPAALFSAIATLADFVADAPFTVARVGGSWEIRPHLGFKVGECHAFLSGSLVDFSEPDWCRTHLSCPLFDCVAKTVSYG